MATHTPAQAIQELVNHTAVLTERLVGLQGEVRKGMNMTPEWGNALTQVVGDTKRMLMAMEHLARLPAFHLDRDGLNAAVAAGVQQGLSSDGGQSLISLIESNSRYLDEAKTELTEAKQRMDTMLEEMQSARVMTPENRQKFFMQFAPIVGMWSVGLLLAGLMLGHSCARPEVVQVPAPAAPPAIVQQVTPPTPAPIVATPAKPAQPAGPQLGSEVILPVDTSIYSGPSKSAAVTFKAPRGARLKIDDVRADGWIRISFATGNGQRATGWIEPGVLKP